MTLTLTNPSKEDLRAVYIHDYMGLGYLMEDDPYKKWSWYWLGYVWAMDIKQAVKPKDLDLIYYN